MVIFTVIILVSHNYGNGHYFGCPGYQGSEINVIVSCWSSPYPYVTYYYLLEYVISYW